MSPLPNTAGVLFFLKERLELYYLGASGEKYIEKNCKDFNGLIPSHGAA